jgi:hypothetical protein
MAELWFDDAAALPGAAVRGVVAATADEAKFVDGSRSAYFVSEERRTF